MKMIANTSDMQMESVWRFVVDHDDMMIILKSLGGRLKQEEIKHALELGARLTRIRAEALERTARQLRAALEE